MGSSPLTRGKPSAAPGAGRSEGLIPAHAGKTIARLSSGPCARAHPRSRGENPPIARKDPTPPGSSPLTRGKRRRGGAAGFRPRLIPAHAGKTSVPCRSRPGSRAHPRSRGENAAHGLKDNPELGSSPLTRGKLVGLAVLGGPVGLIPAHAGKTSKSVGSSLWPGAHPRSRGENMLSLLLSLGDAGSSPLTRGKHFLTCAFIAQIDQILESLELCAFSESYSSQDVYATDAPRDRVRSIDLGLRSSRGAS